jgi:hypothetical protein
MQYKRRRRGCAIGRKLTHHDLSHRAFEHVALRRAQVPVRLLLSLPVCLPWPWRSLEEADLAFEGYLQANLEAEDIDPERLADLNRTVQTWMHETFTSHFDELGPFEGWDQFYVQFPESSGYYRFARPVVFEHSGFALSHIDLICGWFCGGGYYVLLRKQGNDWEFVAYFNDWTI